MTHAISRAAPLVAAAMLCGAGGAGAGDNDISLSPSLSQGDFNTLVDELGMVTAYAPFSPAETLGVTGFELGASLTMARIDDSVWSEALSDADAPSMLPVPRLMVRKGLPLGIDIGASYTGIPDSNVTIIGGELRKSLIEGTTAVPAVSVLGHFSNLSGVDDLDLSTYGVDLGISKGFAMFTPYGGIGQVWYEGTEHVTGVTLDSRDSSETRGYLGMRIGFLPFMNLTAQADFTSAVNSYTLRLNLGF
ncbi:MAG: hypothetical protein IT488_10285 [Gammaproteobacteria bacterium]|nr:hypothetical protein [Gammaproteobacteria bacterium]